MNVEDKLKKLGLKLPSAPPPAANYKRCVQVGNLAFFSGQLPWVDGKMRYAGHVGSDLTDKEGYEAAKLCALNALAQIKAELGSLDRLETIVRVEGHVNSAPGWTGHPQVLNGASDLFAEVLGERAGHARTALGHNELPLNAAVELVLIVAVKGA
ncbi:MAG: RidA family protein [Planctomycetota bacterium]